MTRLVTIISRLITVDDDYNLVIRVDIPVIHDILVHILLAGGAIILASEEAFVDELLTGLFLSYILSRNQLTAREGDDEDVPSVRIDTDCDCDEESSPTD